MNSENFNTVNINEVIISFLTGSITDTEREILYSWLKKDPENEELFNDMVKTWQFSGTIKQSSHEVMQIPWRKLEIRIAHKHEEHKKEDLHRLSPKRTFKMRKVLTMAAFIALAFIIGGTATYFYAIKNNLTLNSQIYQVIVPNGTRSEIVLADNTKVWLNAGSKLTYKQNFGMKTREVELVGEAFFQVKTDISKPFTVNSSGLVIKALGTSFNVKAYPEEQTMVTLVEGELTIEGRSIETGKFKYVLTPKQNLIITKTDNQSTEASKNSNLQKSIIEEENKPIEQYFGDVQITSNVNTELYTSWKDNRWIIKEEPLGNLIIMLERRYNVKIIYEPGELENFSFTGIIEDETLEQVMNILQLSAPLKCEFGKGEVKLEIDKNQQKNFQMVM
jgi:transmembrane sensor